MDDLEIVRGAFFNRQDIPCLTIYQDVLTFNSQCVKLLSGSEYVQLSVGREDMNIHVRGCRGYDFDAVRWYDMRKGKMRGRKIRSRMMVAMLFEKLGYDIGHKYRFFGEYREDVPELVFNTADPLMYVLKDIDGMKRFEERYPLDWKDSFGTPASDARGHRLNTFEEYTVLDVTLEKVGRVNGDTEDESGVERLEELKAKYIKGENL